MINQWKNTHFIKITGKLTIVLLVCQPKNLSQKQAGQNLYYYFLQLFSIWGHKNNI